MFDLTETQNADSYMNEEAIADYLRQCEVPASIGTPTRELVVKPAAAIFTKIDQKLSDLINNLDITIASDEYATLLLANFGMQIEEPSVVSGTLIIYTESDSDFMIPQDCYFSINDQELVTTQSTIGTINDITDKPEIYTKLSPIGNLFYIKVPVISSLPLTKDIAINSTVNMLSDIPDVHSVVSGSVFTVDNNSSSLAQLKDNRLSGITSPSLSSPIQIDSFLKRTSLGVLSTSTKGMLDAVMTRGLNNIYGVKTGGYADIYVRSSRYIHEVSFEVSCIKQSNGNYSGVISKDKSPGFYKIVSITSQTGITLTDASVITTSFSCDISDEEYIPDCVDSQVAFTKFQTCAINFKQPSVTDPVHIFTVKVLTLPNIDLIQNAVSDPKQRNVTCDHLVRAVVPCILTVEVVISHHKGDSPPDVSILKEIIAEGITDIPISQTYLSGSDVVLAISKQYPEVSVKLPVIFTGFIIDQNREYHYVRNTNTLEILNKPEIGITPDITAFFTTPSDVSITFINDKE